MQMYQMKDMLAAAELPSHEALRNAQLSLAVCFDSETGGAA